MAFWKDKEGKEVSLKEFITRWKEGISKVTPLQQTGSTIFFTYMMLVGILCGMIVAVLAWDKFWWGFIILLAAFGNTTVSLIGLNQKYAQLKQIYNQINEVKGG